MKRGHCPPGWISVPVRIKNSQKQEVEISCKCLLKALNLSLKLKGKIPEDFLLLCGLKAKAIVIFLLLEKLDGCCWFAQSLHF